MSTINRAAVGGGELRLDLNELATLTPPPPIFRVLLFSRVFHTHPRERERTSSRPAHVIIDTTQAWKAAMQRATECPYKQVVPADTLEGCAWVFENMRLGEKHDKIAGPHIPGCDARLHVAI